MTAPMYRSVDHLSGEHRPSKLSVDPSQPDGDVCRGCAENAELRCRVQELTEENKTLTLERDGLLTKIRDDRMFGGPW